MQVDEELFVADHLLRQAARSTSASSSNCSSGNPGRPIRCPRSAASSQSAFPCARARPRTRSTIHFRTRMFSPKPGQRNLPSASLRNQFTWKIAGRLAERALHLDPVAEVVAHVVAAEGQHRHRVATDLADGARGGGGHFRSHRGADVDAGAPVECLVDQRHRRRATAAEDDRADRARLRVLPVRDRSSGTARRAP